MQREAWRSDRWASGATITLGPREVGCETDIRALGFAPDSFSPATLDAARWAWLHVQLGRMTLDQLRVRVAWHAAKD